MRATLAVLAVLSVPVAVFLGQVAALALPGSQWLESNAIVLVIALVAIFWEPSGWYGGHPRAECPGWRGGMGRCR